MINWKLFYQIPIAATLLSSAFLVDVRSQDTQDLEDMDFNQSKQEPKNISREITLKEALEEGLRKNSEEKIRDYSKEILEIEWNGVYDSFWYPNVALVLSTGNQNIDRLKSANNNGNNNITSNRAPSGYAGLQLGEYTIFNWGKDYLDYLNKKYKNKRDQENLESQRRQLKLQIIDQFFNLSRVKKILQIRSDKLRQASFLYRFTRQKASLGKTTKQNYYESRVEFLQAQAQYHEIKTDVISTENDMGSILGEKNKKNYRTPEFLKFEKLKVTEMEASEFANSKNVAILNSKLELENANRTYQITQKENLPLPKFTVNLGTYKKRLDNDANETSFETHPGNSNVEVIASVNMTWDVFGENGFFNHRKNKKAFLNKKISEIRHTNAKQQVNIRVRSLFETINQQEKQIEAAQLQKQNARISFDSALENYMDNKIRYNELKNQLEDLYDSQIYLENAKYAHLVKKLELVDIMGLDDFPGENFEQLAVREAHL